MQNNAYKNLSLDEAKQKLDTEAITLIDFRDENSFRQAHIPGAQNITREHLEAFAQQLEKSKPIIIYCYHGNSSQGAAQYLISQGFSEVYSISGGFEAWRVKYGTSQ